MPGLNLSVGRGRGGGYRGPSPGFDFNNILKPGGTPPPTSINQAQPSPFLTDVLSQYKTAYGTPDPYMQEQLSLLRDRLSSDTTKHAQEMASSSINEDLLGAKSRLAGDLARRGISDSGVATTEGRKLEEAAQREKARSSSQIAADREGRLDALVLGSSGIFGAPGARSERLLSGMAGAAGNVSSQQLAQQQLAQQAANQAQAQQMAMMQLLASLWQ